MRKILYLTKKGIIEYFEGNNFVSVEPVFIIWADSTDEEFENQLNPYELVYISLDGWKFEIQPHMFSLKGKPSTPPAPIVVSFDLPHMNISERSIEKMDLNWSSPVQPVYFVSSDSAICDIDSFTNSRVFLEGLSVGDCSVMVYLTETDELLDTLAVTVVT